MRLIGYFNHELKDRCIGAVEGDQVRPLAQIDDFYCDPFTKRELGPAMPLEGLHQLPVVPPTSRVMCVGLNYKLHIEETSSQRPDYPNIFARWYASLCCDGDEIPMPDDEPGLDWEVELAVIIGRPMRSVTPDEALDGVFAYTAFNDLSARGMQRATSQWALGKNAERSGPIGPVAVTADEIADPHNLRLTTRVNGETMQDGNTADMLFSIGEILSYASKAFTLVPGDVIATGTPAGVGSQMDPPRFLTPGDTCEVEVENIGTITNRFVDRL